MPWQQIDRQYVKQDQPGLETQWYWDTTSRGGGELLLWVEPEGEIDGFQLSYEQWPSGRHYVCKWDRATGFQTGFVDEGETRVRLRKQSAIMRFSDVIDQQVVSLLTRYFRANCSALPDDQREHIGGVLGEAAQAA